MDSGSSSVLAAGRGQGDGGGGGDRLSKLGDAALGHILSFLPATEAARTATLSRRWRHVFAAVHALSFRETEPRFRMGYRWWRRCSYCDNGDMRALQFVAGVSAALHGRHRGARGAATAPLRALRVTFDESGFRGGNDATEAVDGWLSYAVHGAGEALEIDLRLDTVTEPICEQAYALASGGGPDDDAKMADEEEPRPGEDKYIMPRSLFSSCAVLRVLRLGGCWINLPSAIALPSLDTLHLTKVTGRRGTIQRLVSACPSLVDLAIPAASPPPFLTMHSPRKISFYALDFCGVERAAAEVLGLTELFAGVERLHLTSARLGSSFVSHGGAFPCFPRLRNLEITGMIPDYDADASAAISTVARILQRTPRLETLSLFFLPEPDPVPVKKESRHRYLVGREVIDASHKLRYNPHACLAAPPRDVVEVPLLSEGDDQEINLVHYQGSVAQRALAKFLLCNAPVVDEVCWKVARGPLSIQTKLMVEIKGWVMNKSANMIFF